MAERNLTAEEQQWLAVESNQSAHSGPVTDELMTTKRCLFAETDPYDLRRQTDALQSFHQDVASRFADALSRGLQRLVECELAAVSAMSYSQFAYSRSNPTCYCVLQATPLPASLALDLSPQLLYPILDCLLGGGKRPCEIPHRAPTELEQRLAKRVVQLLLDELHDAWEPLLAVNLSVDRIDSLAQRVRVVAPGDAVIALEFQACVAEQHGCFTLCLPCRAVRKMVDRLLVGEFHAPDPVAAAGNVDESPWEMTVQFPASPMTIEQIDRLDVGDLLHTGLQVDDPMDVLINGQLVYQGRPGSMQGRRAVAIASRARSDVR
jgi:flagellar motor switch protein FliM